MGLSGRWPGLVGFAVVGGWVAMVAALAVFALTLVLVLIRVPSGQALPLLKRSGLVFLNFVCALAAIWLVVFSGIGI